jgi:hypothetical protein
MPSFDPGTNVLVQAPSLSSERADQCLDMLAVGDPATLDVLRIVYSGKPQELLDQWREEVGTMPARTGIVVVGGAPDFEGTTEVDSGETVAVTTANPNDITGLGMRLNNYLNDTPPEAQLVVCLDSLTELLQFVDVQSAFKFLHMFTGQLREAGAIGHFHIDPNAHDAQTISRLKPAFDEELTL